MKRAMLMTIILAFGMIGARAEVLAAQCSSYYISEINLVSTAERVNDFETVLFGI
jgi:hypothetical protein